MINFQARTNSPFQFCLREWKNNPGINIKYQQKTWIKYLGDFCKKYNISFIEAFDKLYLIRDLPNNTREVRINNDGWKDWLPF